MAKHAPSKVANVCFYLARKCCNLRTVWGEDLQEYTGYTLASMQDCIQQFEQCPEISQLIRYATNNFREGPRAAYLNNLSKPAKNQPRWSLAPVSKEVERSYKIFDTFLRSRDIEDPYALLVKKVKPSPSTALDALDLQDCTVRQ